ncbi:sigma-70 family RNA polymerase sigma factor [Microbacterium sp. BWT-B31]|uniref:sigma-70 family RNA polymerase sigma factor n=1 Tax=Microbacterium sp. BWT-B31 TaxID=3232072 RepID=UPI003527D0A0
MRVQGWRTSAADGQTLPHEAAPTDRELLDATRAGDCGAFGVLWDRHVNAAYRIARSFHGPGWVIDVEDIVSESFAAILQTVRSGGGPEFAFRSYLAAVVRNEALRRTSCIAEVGGVDLDQHADPVTSRDPVEHAFDSETVVLALRSLPPHWQEVLWMTQVDRKPLAQAARSLGISENAAAQLSFRAREGLRTAWVQAHLDEECCSGGRECLWMSSRFGAYARGALSSASRERVAQHLAECAMCDNMMAEARRVASALSDTTRPFASPENRQTRAHAVRPACPARSRPVRVGSPR